MATFGVTDTSGVAESPGANYKVISKFTLTEDGTVNKLSFYMTGSGGFGANVKAFIYADSGGTPAALEAVGSVIAVAWAENVFSWYDSDISPAVELAAGDYWLGFKAEAAMQYSYHSVSNNRKYRAETYASSPSDPFGTVEGTDNKEVTVYATYDPVTSGQTLLVSADSADGNWRDQSGGSSLATAIDETSASDSDYIHSPDTPQDEGTRLKLASGSDPASSTGHDIKWRIRKIGTDTIDMTVKLYQGGGDSLGAGTLIASFDRTDVSTTFTEFTETLSGAEADSITDYSDLYLEFFADVP
jgi:hypothetical protein